MYTCVQAPNRDRCVHPAASLPKPRSGLCGTRAREAPQRGGGWQVPPPTICSRSDTHSGLLQAFFSPVLRSQRHLLVPWQAICGGSSCLPSPTRLPNPCRHLGSLSCLCLGADGPSATVSAGRPTGAPSPPQVPSPAFAAVQAFPLKSGQGLWSPQIFPRQGPETSTRGTT